MNPAWNAAWISVQTALVVANNSGGEKKMAEWQHMDLEPEGLQVGHQGEGG